MAFFDTPVKQMRPAAETSGMQICLPPAKTEGFPTKMMDSRKRGILAGLLKKGHHMDAAIMKEQN